MIACRKYATPTCLSSLGWCYTISNDHICVASPKVAKQVQSLWLFGTVLDKKACQSWAFSKTLFTLVNFLTIHLWLCAANMPHLLAYDHICVASPKVAKQVQSLWLFGTVLDKKACQSWAFSKSCTSIGKISWQKHLWFCAANMLHLLVLAPLADVTQLAMIIFVLHHPR